MKTLHKYNGLRKLTIYWFAKIFTISIKENIVFVKLFKTSFGGNKLAWFAKFQYQGTDTFSSIRM